MIINGKFYRSMTEKESKTVDLMFLQTEEVSKDDIKHLVGDRIIAGVPCGSSCEFNLDFYKHPSDSNYIIVVAYNKFYGTTDIMYRKYKKRMID